MASIILRMDVIRLTSNHDHEFDVQCVSCNDSLVIHQPDEVRPSRLLGTCPECGAWFLIDADRSVMIRLPDEDALGNA